MKTKTKSITLQDLILYNFDGKPYRTYDTMRLTPFPITENWKAGIERVTRLTQNEWISEGIHPASLPLWYALLERLQESNSAQYTTLLNKIGEGCPLMTSTIIDREKGIVTHNYGMKEAFSLPCFLPETGKMYRPDSRTMLVEGAMRDQTWRTTIQALFMCQDLEKVPRVLKMYERSPALWVATEKVVPLQPVTVEINYSSGIGIMVHPDRRGTVYNVGSE